MGETGLSAGANTIVPKTILQSDLQFKYDGSKTWGRNVTRYGSVKVWPVMSVPESSVPETTVPLIVRVTVVPGHFWLNIERRLQSREKNRT